VPASIRKERPELPEVVPFGPDDPLGTHALRLSSRSILIHGTNKPFGVGRRVSHGCIRLYPEDIARLYRIVPVGTAVTIVRQPVKAGQDGDRVFVEVHADEGGGPPLEPLSEAKRLLADRGMMGRVDLAKLEAAVREKSGVPVDVTR
jgi:L,D-transpeptidase ErfK/SrfK